MKILMLTQQNIFDHKPNGGIQLAIANYKAIISAAGKDNTFLCIVSNDKITVSPNLNVVPRLTNRLVLAALSPFGYKLHGPITEKKILTYIKKINPDIIFFDGSLLGRISKKISKVLNKEQYLFLHNIERDYALNKMKKESFVFLPSFLSSWISEGICIKNAKKVFCLNKRDSLRMEQVYHRTPTAIIPISFTDNFEKLRVQPYNGKKNILFIGSLFPPNYDGIKWFIENVMSELTDDFQLFIVGKNFEKKRDSLEKHNVKVIGGVDDLSTYYYSFPLLVMPILYGDGMKVKTAEALMYGKAILGTKEAFEGYELESSYCITCDTAQQFRDNIYNYFERNDISNFYNEVRAIFLRKYEASIVQRTLAEAILDGTHIFGSEEYFLNELKQ